MYNNFSIVIPIYNEEKSISDLIIEIYNCLSNINYKFEIILINDCSNDETILVLKKLKKKYNIKYFNNEKNMGQSFSILNGVRESKFSTIVTLDGDGQNNPKDIIKLVKIYFDQDKIKLVGGIRKKRKDNFIKIFSSRIANNIRKIILKDNCSDTGCGLKVFDKKIFLSFPFFTGLHRFLPALFKAYGYTTIYEEVDHRERKAGYSKYGTIDRLIKGIIDIIRVLIIIKRNNN